MTTLDHQNFIHTLTACSARTRSLKARAEFLDQFLRSRIRNFI
jgi:hypothetical protein